MPINFVFTVQKPLMNVLWEVAHCMQESDGNCVSDTELRFLITLGVIFENTGVDKRKREISNALGIWRIFFSENLQGKYYHKPEF